MNDFIVKKINKITIIYDIICTRFVLFLLFVYIVVCTYNYIKSN